MNTLPEEFNIKALRKKLGMSQRDFSKTFHIGYRSIHDYEQNRKRINARTMAYLMVIDAMPNEVLAVMNGIENA